MASLVNNHSGCEIDFDNCERQLLELEAIESIFGQEFAHGNPEAHALICATHESAGDISSAQFSWNSLPMLEATLHLPHCCLRFTLPHDYPASEAPICSIDESPDPSILADLIRQAEERIGQESLLFLIEQCRDHCEEAIVALADEALANDSDLALAMQLSETPEASATDPCTKGGKSTGRTFGRRCIYSHHIIAASKRAAVMQGALDRGLSGASKIGWPGVIIVEGEEEQCQAYVRMLTSLRWKFIVVRGEEIFAIPDGKTVEDLRRFPPGFREFEASQMSQMATYCKEAGLHKLFMTVFKKHRG